MLNYYLRKYYTTRNIDKIDKNDWRIDAFLLRDKSRGFQAYGLVMDQNGSYYIYSDDSPDPWIEAEYAFVHFFLETDEHNNQDIYLAGKLTGWNISDDYKMDYFEESKVYTKSLLLKQGIYDYQFLVPGSSNPNILEGNHIETNNEYEIIVYYFHPVLRTDVIIGYHRFKSNQ